MPIIKSAIKKLRQDKKRTVRNRATRVRYKERLKKALADPTKENVNQAVSAIDRAAKKRVIHRNKAARLKSRAMRAKKATSEPDQKTKKTTKKKGSPKKAKKAAPKIDSAKTKK